MFSKNARWRRQPGEPPRAGVPPDAWCRPPWEWDRRSAGGGWQPPRPWDAEPLPGPAAFPSSPEDGRWAPWGRPPLPGPWDRGEDYGGAEDGFGDGWQPVPPPRMSCWGASAWPPFPGEEQPPAVAPGKRGGFAPSWGWKRRRPFRRRRWEKFASSCRPSCPPVSREKLPSSRPSASCSAESRAAGREKPRRLRSPCEDGGREGEQADPPSHAVPEPPGQANAEQEHAAGAEPDAQMSPLRPAARPPVQPPALAREPAPTEGVRAGRELVPLGAAAQPDEGPGRGGSDVCAAPAASPGTGRLRPASAGEPEPAQRGREAAAGCRGARSPLPAPSASGRDLRSAAVLARKEEIELSYQRFSLAFAMVATMLLQKEPSMEAAMGLALRATLRQVRSHHLQELENFINSYDAATASR